MHRTFIDEALDHGAARKSRATQTTISRILLLKGAIWTVGAFGVGQFIRLATNVALTRLLAPELFGIMQIVFSLRTGVELISDVGIGQNIIYNKNANNSDFYDTAWSVQLIRGLLLWLAFSAAAVLVARFYHYPILVAVIPTMAFGFVLDGFSSTSRFLLQKRMKFGALTVFNSVIALVAAVAQIILAYFNPTIWSLVFGLLIGATASMIGSHFLLSDVRQRFLICRRYVVQILSFGKWIFVSSIIYFLSTNFDRLYLAKTIPLGLLGVYGIARALAELLSAVVQHLGSSVIFPFVAAHSHIPRDDLRAQLAPIRMKFLLLTGFGFSLFAATADLAIRVLYDQRYQAAGWMLPVLVVGAWFSAMANLNESTLLGLGKPNYGAFSNGGKFAFLLIGLPSSILYWGVPGGIMTIGVSDLCRYVPILGGQLRERFSFAAQDVAATVAVFGLIAFWEWLRWAWGFGTSFDAFSGNIPAIFGLAW